MKYKLRPVTKKDQNDWLALSHEYDRYIDGLVGTTTEWYDGNAKDSSFQVYMDAKITQGEARIVTEAGKCAGVIAFSKKNYRITFFAVSHQADFREVGCMMIENVLKELSSAESISVNIVKSEAPVFLMERELFQSFHFKKEGDSSENGVPVEVFMGKP